MKIHAHFCAALLAIAAATLAHAQAWPTKPIRAIVPFPPGSGTDTTVRPVLNQLSKQLGQPIVIENRPGAGGTIGMGVVAQAAPDGYTLLLTSNSFTVVPATYTKLAFDPVGDFVGVVPVANLPMALVVAPSKGFRAIGDLISAAKAKPGSINYASAGAGGATHLGAERFRMAAGFDAVHVPYKGSGEALTDVITGRVDFYFSPIGLALPQIKAGKLAALALSSTNRSSALPDIPTMLEAGLRDSDFNVWLGMMVHAKTPRDLLERLHAETVKAIRAPEVVETFQKLVAEPMIMSLEQFATLLREEVAMNATLVKVARISSN